MCLERVAVGHSGGAAMTGKRTEGKKKQEKRPLWGFDVLAYNFNAELTCFAIALVFTASTVLSFLPTLSFLFPCLSVIATRQKKKIVLLEHSCAIDVA
jgi:hypothetical protein